MQQISATCAARDSEDVHVTAQADEMHSETDAHKPQDARVLTSQERGRIQVNREACLQRKRKRLNGCDRQAASYATGVGPEQSSLMEGTRLGAIEKERIMARGEHSNQNSGRRVFR